MRDIPAAAEMDPDPLVLPMTGDGGGGGAGRNMVPSPKYFSGGMEADSRRPAPAPLGHESRDIRRRRQPSGDGGPWGTTGDGGREDWRAAGAPGIGRRRWPLGSLGRRVGYSGLRLQRGSGWRP